MQPGEPDQHAFIEHFNRSYLTEGLAGVGPPTER